jgi:hypothetical protein
VPRQSNQRNYRRFEAVSSVSSLLITVYRGALIGVDGKLETVGHSQFCS